MRRDGESVPVRLTRTATIASRSEPLTPPAGGFAAEARGAIGATRGGAIGATGRRPVGLRTGGGFRIEGLELFELVAQAGGGLELEVFGGREHLLTERLDTLREIAV